MRTLRVGLLVAAVHCVIASLCSLSSAQTIREFYFIHANVGLGAITAGPDGNIWFTEGRVNKVGYISPNGHAQNEFSVTDTPLSIAAGPDGNLWIAEGRKIGRMTPRGVLTEFPVGAVSITKGRPKAGVNEPVDMWFTVFRGIGRITMDGTSHTYSTPMPPEGITAGPGDGNIWFTESESFPSDAAIARTNYVFGDSIDITEFELPFASSPGDITAGPDGNLWFTERGDFRGGGKIGRITTSGTITHFPVAGLPMAITAGPDGNLWFTEPDINKIGRMTPQGAVTEFVIPTANSNPQDITAGPDGNIWFTEGRANTNGLGDRIWRIEIPTAPPTPTATHTLPSTRTPSPSPTPSPTPTRVHTPSPTFTTPILCPGDCNGDGSVKINELITGVNIALGNAALDTCPSFDASGNAQVEINELIRAVNAALNGCAG